MLNIQKNFFNLHNDLPLLPERMKTEKCNKLACRVHDIENYVCAHKSFKANIKSWIKTKKGTQSNSI